MTSFDANAYGAEVRSILALDGDGARPMPLLARGCSSETARQALRAVTPSNLFPNSPHPEAALAGLWLYFSCFEEAHTVAQDVASAEGSFWHAIVHRREPDAGNSGYWFRRVGKHPIYPRLRQAAEQLQEGSRKLFPVGGAWDPFAFIDFCEGARRKPGSDEERLAMELQLIEWQSLFDYCARPAQ